MSRRTAVSVAVLLAFWIVAAVATPAMAHLHERVGDIEFTVGWANEPAFAGEPNAVQVFVNDAHVDPAGAGEHTHAEGEEGGPVDPRRVKLTVEVIFGTKDATVKMDAVPLEPFAFGEPGELRTESLVPTRPGTYTFHFTGTIKGKAFDKFYTSGEIGAIAGTQYNDVRDVGEVSFPAEDPGNDELARALAQARTVAARQAKEAKDDAAGARLFGIIGIGVGVLGLLVAAIRRPKKAAS